MRVLKKLVCLFFVVGLLIVSVGCVRSEIDVDINKNGKGTFTSKISLEESAYKTLVSLSEKGQFNLTSDSVPLDLEKFKKEKIDGTTYYSYKEKLKFSSYKELADAIKGKYSFGEDVNAFKSVDISRSDKKSYDFKLITRKLNTDSTSVGSIVLPVTLPEKWFVISIDVTMPGKIIESNGEFVNNQTVRFVLTDFDESYTYTAHSEVKTGFWSVFLWIVLGALFISIGFVVFKKIKTK